jgi:hypothetical protein
MPICQKCGVQFPNRVKIDDSIKVTNSRRYCLTCSPYGEHNTKQLHNLTTQPTPLEPSCDLAYLLGVIAGDGCIYKHKRTCELIITCDTRYPDLIAIYSNLVAKLIPGRVRVVYAKNRKYASIRICNSHLVSLTGLSTGPKAHSGFELPEWVFSSTTYVKWLMRGLIETDGGVYKIT